MLGHLEIVEVLNMAATPLPIDEHTVFRVICPG
jgi:hypothetical protein